MAAVTESVSHNAAPIASVGARWSMPIKAGMTRIGHAYFNSPVLPLNTRYENTVYPAMAGTEMQTPIRITLSAAGLLAACQIVNWPITT